MRFILPAGKNALSCSLKVFYHMRRHMIVFILVGLALILSTFISAVFIVQKIAYAQPTLSSNGQSITNGLKFEQGTHSVNLSKVAKALQKIPIAGTARRALASAVSKHSVSISIPTFSIPLEIIISPRERG